MNMAEAIANPLIVYVKRSARRHTTDVSQRPATCAVAFRGGAHYRGLPRICGEAYCPAANTAGCRDFVRPALVGRCQICLLSF